MCAASGTRGTKGMGLEGKPERVSLLGPNSKGVVILENQLDRKMPVLLMMIKGGASRHLIGMIE